jgi:hypothetical protein
MIQISEASDSVIYTDQTVPLGPQAALNIRKAYEPVKPRDKRAIRLENFLRLQQSDLASQADLLVELSDGYGIDYKIPVAIAGMESGYCNAAYYANNCWGFGRFEWPTIEAGVRGYLSKMNQMYFKNGLTTIQDIAPLYNKVNTEGFIEKAEHHYNLIP